MLTHPEQQQQQQHQTSSILCSAGNDVTTTDAAVGPPLSALEWKERGNKLYSLGKLDEALEAYDCSIQGLEEESISSSTSSSLAVLVWSNRALVLIKMRKFHQAEQASSKVLAMDPDNVKGMQAEK